jgi:hypothetical protein
MPKSLLGDVLREIRESKGEYGAKRVQRAADKIPGLENMYSKEGLLRAFGGDNAKALMLMNPADFEKYAQILSIKLSSSEKRYEKNNRDEIETSKYPKGYMSTDNYVKHLAAIKQYHDVPLLQINKEEQGLPITPYISGHEGRHRNRALATQGVGANLIQLLPRSELREGFPRRSQEEYVDALRQEMDMTNHMVYPEKIEKYRDRPPIKLPEFFTKGGSIAGQAKATVDKAAGKKVTPAIDMTTASDLGTTLGDAVRARAAKMMADIAMMHHKYKPGQYVMTKHTVEKNFPPMKILHKTVAGGTYMRDPSTHKVMLDAEGNRIVTPKVPAYRIRHEIGPEDWHEYDLPEHAIIGDVELAKGGSIHNKQRHDMSQMDEHGYSTTSPLGALGATAWHGSPHLIGPEGFQASKIGTGEGAQAYGHGLYLAEAPKVAESYKYSTSKPELSIAGKRYVADAGGTLRDESGKVLQGVPQHLEDAANALFGSKADKPLGILAEEAESFLQSRRGMTEARIAKAKDAILQGQVKPEPRGYLYKTDISDEAVARFLDWDKPLSQQHPDVQGAVNTYINSPTGLEAAKEYHGYKPGMTLLDLPGFNVTNKGDPTGETIYKAIFGSGDAAANSLSSNGIPGIRYLDGSSRSAGQGSSNFVVFDPEMIRILERNGQPTGAQPWKPGEYQAKLAEIKDSKHKKSKGKSVLPLIPKFKE